MRFHVVGLPHLATLKSYSSCAYTQKVLKFCSMMRSLGHEVYHYGAEGSEVDCTEHITVITKQKQVEYFGEYDPQRLPTIQFDVNHQGWRHMNRRAAEAIDIKQERGDFLCLIAGVCQKPIALDVGEARCITVEYGIGYYGTFAKYRVFESYTHQSCVYGQQSMDPDGRLYDAVIPNYFDPADFPFLSKKQGYLLFLARVVQRKGIAIAVATARASGKHLIVAGPGVLSSNGSHLVLEDGGVIEVDETVEYVGYTTPQQRAELMSNALALIQPTIFMEPFGGNVVEAAMCGTPAITTDYAAFSETVKHGITGYRCSTLKHFVEAVGLVGTLDPAEIRRNAVWLYSMGRVKHMYQAYFEGLLDLWGAGWPTL